MPPGKVHYRIWKIAFPFIIVISILLTTVRFFRAGDYSPIGMIIGYALGSFVDPDLDQLTITGSEARLMKRFKILGAFIVAYFFVYAYIFKHRGISHWHIIGTLTRWVWMLFPITCILFYYGGWYDVYVMTQQYIVWVFIGNSISDSFHILADMGHSFISKFFSMNNRAKNWRKKYGNRFE